MIVEFNFGELITINNILETIYKIIYCSTNDDKVIDVLNDAMLYAKDVMYANADDRSWKKFWEYKNKKYFEYYVQHLKYQEQHKQQE